MIDIYNKRAFIEACAAAFAWVSYSDGELTDIEVDRFISMLNESDYVDQISSEDFEEAYLGLLDVFKENYDEGVVRAEARLDLFKEDQVMAREILKYAQEAMYADHRVEEKELEAVSEIEWILGLKEMNH